MRPGSGSARPPARRAPSPACCRPERHRQKIPSPPQDWQAPVESVPLPPRQQVRQEFLLPQEAVPPVFPPDRFLREEVTAAQTARYHQTSHQHGKNSFHTITIQSFSVFSIPFLAQNTHRQTFPLYNSIIKGSDSICKGEPSFAQENG